MWAESVPDVSSAPGTSTKYSGTCWYRSSHVFFKMREPIYDDTTFEIFRRVMDERHTDDLLIGLHLGKSYDDAVFEANLLVVSKGPLVTFDPTISENDRQAQEIKKYKELAKSYFVQLPDTFETLVK